MKLELRGAARRFGDDVNTDYIIASTRKRETLDADVLKRYLFETLDPDFAGSVRDGDIIVAGRNFGCGSAMEVAATVLLAAGIRVIIATSFSRTFYRNAINNGLLPVECDTSAMHEGDRLTVRGAGGTIEVLRGDTLVGVKQFSSIVLRILDAGGLVSFLRDRGRFD